MNQELIDKRWKLTRQELKKFQVWYKKQNKRTQDKIQEIINYYDISYNDLNKNIKSSDKERLNRKIEEWQELGIYDGYFKYRVEELNKYNINYHDLIEILLYGAFMEESQGINTEINTLFQNVSQDCYNQGLNDLGKSEKTISHSFLDTFNLTLIDGIVFADYLNALYLTNTQEIQKQYLISLQQNKKLDVYGDVIERQLEKQRNRLICANDDKYSGGLDKYVTALGNRAYLEASSGYNAEVKFISDHCEHVTEMCSYMDGMVFNTEKRNVFTRPYGDTSKDLALQEMDIMGLVIGINQPPITKHPHWCHSCLSYLVDKSADELREMIFKEDITTNGIYLYEDESGTKNNKTIIELINNVRKITSNKFQNRTKGVRIIRSKENLSYYDVENNIINLKNNADEYNLIHELAHKFQQTFTKEEQEVYNKIITKKFNGYTKKDFVKIKSKAGGKYYVLKDYSEFISKYQTRVYNGGFTLLGKLDLDYIQEYFSEGVKYYYKDSNLLKNKDIMLYKFIKRVVDD